MAVFGLIEVSRWMVWIAEDKNGEEGSKVGNGQGKERKGDS